ncbi:hypothetical protein A2634_03250 [Candidatus Amesbacteria bacterium RIFCSPHIGHO2_01_FULL_48_32]|uniref:Uncharacterized protein n=1 Tax=Candidatus Amesbacteria bacterium RIFCSPLOWO2_01_FULL_48_25 TaxID=1797259 RepID=A0A1F4ZBL4_9BACT|nr:MAG: hypothetical protein A2634_03250 [Candidatus Amesbacteria bacterium RIFCSPHIGHO2_01_FULL_48_32]OGD03575.1 MAG: hypothetical protein A2989_02740 [Candidatus Amesbacteria bacterium RIFCSPLOWO2_01_FULL_48_25]HJZ04673.1 hypothetical protein [Patescibacteria group bacterium]
MSLQEKEYVLLDPAGFKPLLELARLWILSTLAPKLCPDLRSKKPISNVAVGWPTSPEAKILFKCPGTPLYRVCDKCPIRTTGELFKVISVDLPEE